MTAAPTFATPANAEMAWSAAGLAKLWQRKASQEKMRLEAAWRTMTQPERDKAMPLLRLSARHIANMSLAEEILRNASGEQFTMADKALASYVEASSPNQRRSSYVEGFRDLSNWMFDHRLSFKRMRSTFSIGTALAFFGTVVVIGTGAVAAQHLGLNASHLAHSCAAWTQTPIAKHLAIDDITVSAGFVKNKGIEKVFHAVESRPLSDKARRIVSLARLATMLSTSHYLDEGIDLASHGLLEPLGGAGEGAHIQEAAQVPVEDSGTAEKIGDGMQQATELVKRTNPVVETLFDQPDEQSPEAAALWRRVKGLLFAYASFEDLAKPAGDEGRQLALEALDMLKTAKDSRPGWGGRPIGRVMEQRLSTSTLSRQDVLQTLHLCDAAFDRYEQSNPFERAAILARYPTPVALRAATNASSAHAGAIRIFATMAKTTALATVDASKRAVHTVADGIDAMLHDDDANCPS